MLPTVKLPTTSRVVVVTTPVKIGLSIFAFDSISPCCTSALACRSSTSCVRVEVNPSRELIAELDAVMLARRLSTSVETARVFASRSS